MILHRLLIEDFRGVRREEVEVPEKGVLVIEGPNESGKTSLVDALEMLLEHKASSGRAEVKATSPVGRDVPVVIEAEFTVDSERLVYRKEFVRGKKTSLEFPGSAKVALAGDDAHDYVRDLLDRRVDRSLWRALRIAQDDPISQVKAGQGMGSLRRALDAAAGGADPTGDDSLVARVAEERNRYLTARKGDPTGDLARSETRVAEARSALSEAQARHAELDAAVADHVAESANHKARTDSLVALEAEVARLETAGKKVADLREASRVAIADVDRAVVAHEAADRERKNRAELVARHEAAVERAKELATDSGIAEARLGPAEERAQAARTALEVAEATVSQTRAALDAARAQRERERQRTDLRTLETTLGVLREVGEELAARESELEQVTVPEGAVDRLRTADEELREAIVRSAASAPRVEVGGEGALTVAGDPVDAADGWSREIVEDTIFEVGQVSLTVVPARDTDTMRRDEATARARLDTLLEELGVETPAEAEQRARRAEGLAAEVVALRRRRTDVLAGDTPEDVDRRRQAIADDLATQPDDTDETDDRDGKSAASGEGESPAEGTADPVATAAEAEESLTRLRAEDRTASAEAEACRTEFATRTALSEDATGRLAEAETVLTTARSTIPDAKLAEAEEAAKGVAETAREIANRAAQHLDEALADAPPELLDNARASLASLLAEERDSAAAVATALGRVNAIGDQGRLEDVSATEREVDAAERENTALWRRARAADLLHRTLEERRAEALLAYQEPFHRAVVELGALVYGRDFDVLLSEDLTILSRRLDAVSVDYDSLSGGAREQLSVIVRIACARFVGDDGVPVFLDDTMGYTDPTRRLTMGAVIAAAGTTSQLVVLTCDRARFAGIGGAKTHVMGRSEVESD